MLFYINLIHNIIYCNFNINLIKNLNIKLILLKPKLIKVSIKIYILSNNNKQIINILFKFISKVNYNILYYNFNKFSLLKDFYFY